MTNINLTAMFSDVLKWNVCFGVPVPDDNTFGMLSLLQEEYEEFASATTDTDKVDALGDMLVVALGICARLVVLPYRCPAIAKRAGQAASKIKLDRRSIQSVADCIHGSTDMQQSLSEFIELILIHCQNANIDIVPIFERIMIKNWTKYWSESELKEVKAGHTIKRVGGIVVYNKDGKIQKPPSFEHPVHTEIKHEEIPAKETPAKKIPFGKSS